MRVKNVHGGPLALGDVVPFTLFAGPTAGIDDFQFGSERSVFASVRGATLATGLDGHGMGVVIAEPIADGLTGLAWLWHEFVLARVDGPTIVGQPLSWGGVNNGVALDATPIAGSKVIAIAQQAVGGAGLCFVTFYGVIGFGKGGP